MFCFFIKVWRVSIEKDTRDKIIKNWMNKSTIFPAFVSFCSMICLIFIIVDRCNGRYITSKFMKSISIIRWVMSVWYDSLVDCGKSDVYDSQVIAKIKSKNAMILNPDWLNLKKNHTFIKSHWIA